MNKKSEVFVFGKIKLAPSQIENIKPEKANARNPCNPNTKTVSYTHLTLPTICSV